MNIILSLFIKWTFLIFAFCQKQKELSIFLIFKLSPCPLKTATSWVYINLQICFATLKNHESRGKKIEHELRNWEEKSMEAQNTTKQFSAPFKISIVNFITLGKGSFGKKVENFFNIGGTNFLHFLNFFFIFFPWKRDSIISNFIVEN